MRRSCSMPAMRSANSPAIRRSGSRSSARGRYGVGIVAVRHGFHFGTARRYAIQAAKADCIGIVMCNTRPLMPAPGGAERVVGNNPIAIAVPTRRANSHCARHGHQRSGDGQDPHGGEGRSAHSGELGGQVRRQRDHESEPRRSPGMLLPAGGPKGFGLAFLIDLMCGLLSGGASGSAVQPLYGDAARPLRLLASVHRDRCRAFRRSGGDPRGRRRRRRAHPLRQARARRRAAVCAGRAGMAQARKRGRPGHI